MRYADLDNLIADYIPGATKATEKAAVGRILDGVSAFVDSYTNRPTGYFNPVSIPAADEDSEPTLPAPTAKRVRGEGTNFLRLPRHVFGTATIQDVIAGSYYESEVNGWLYFDSPLTNAFDGDETVVNGPDCGGYSPRFWHGRVYLVSAVWGYERTPADLEEAVRQTVVKWYETQRGVLGQITPNGFVIERDIPKSAKLILDNYKKREFER